MTVEQIAAQKTILEEYRMHNVINIIPKHVNARHDFTNNIYIRLMITTSITPSVISRIREHTIGVTE